MTTPSQPFDLERLRSLYAAATAGHWKREGARIISTEPEMTPMLVAGSVLPPDATFIVVMHSAFPAMAAEIENLRESVSILNDAVVVYAETEDKLASEITDLRTRLEVAEADNESLRADMKDAGRGHLLP